MDRLELAAAGLGSNRWRAFWWVTRPLIQPGIATGMLFSFLLSFDDCRWHCSSPAPRAQTRRCAARTRRRREL
jgi:ABC-type glycerol-3-phosphate transport system permease component